MILHLTVDFEGYFPGSILSSFEGGSELFSVTGLGLNLDEKTGNGYSCRGDR